MMKRCLFLLLLATCSLFCNDSYIRKVDSITYRSQGGNTLALIKLSDETVWKWIPDVYSENLLRTWAEGDEILIKTINHPGFILQNLSKPLYSPTVSLTFNSYPLFPTIESVDLENNVILLSDGSQWELMYDFNQRTLRHWSIGDRIIPVRGIHESLELISLDIPHGNCCQVERNIQIASSCYLPSEEPPLALERALPPKQAPPPMETAALQEDESKILESYEDI